MGQLEELKLLKTQEAGKKKQSREIIVAKSDKATVKGVGFNLEAYSSEKGKILAIDLSLANFKFS